PGPVRAGGDNGPLATTVAGGVCMDQMGVDLGPGGSGRFAAGDRVVLMVDPDRDEPSAQAWADAAGTISYEIVTRMSSRLPRRYRGADRATSPTRPTGQSSMSDR
ncbi:MAG: alanine racemase C-terminal domain-containing protein, partial [Acidimicrobiales bacterium]